MAGDLHNAYLNEATSYNSANPTKSRVGVAFSGDAWVSAMNLGIAVQNPYLTNNPPKQVNLWDSDPLTGAAPRRSATIPAPMASISMRSRCSTRSPAWTRF
jgi:hypothetical protein